MSFGLYIHIPYCLQRCTYCDFATYEQNQIMPPQEYISLLLLEMTQQLSTYAGRQVDTVYFGGGTPSLLPAEMIVNLLQGIEKQGLQISNDAEITIEINPATLSEKKMDLYLRAGINRFSVGAQSFNDPLLKSVAREHNSQQTRDTLAFLKSFGVNYSADILFALPGQTLDQLKFDLQEILNFSPNHISPYCLTVPEGHVLSRGRPLEELQLQMFDLIDQTLSKSGYGRYEISNYSKPDFESKHNLLYWTDNEYLGLGLSSHSYIKTGYQWGRRFWNPSTIGAYAQKVTNNEFLQQNEEILELHQAVTDYCHTSLRTQTGLDLTQVQLKFGPNLAGVLKKVLKEIESRGWLKQSGTKWSLSRDGFLLSNQVFAGLTFLRGELPEYPYAP